MAKLKVLPQTESVEDRISGYILNARHYYENSQETLKKKEFSKSGELLWGAIAETVKALFLYDYDQFSTSHGEIRNFLRRLSTLYTNNVLEKWRRSADNLHINFYEPFLDEPTFLEYYDDGEQLYAFLDSQLIKSKKTKKTKSKKPKTKKSKSKKT